MSTTSINGGYCFGFMAVRISPASLNLSVITHNLHDLLGNTLIKLYFTIINH